MLATKKAENLEAGDLFVSLFAMPEYPPAQPISGVIRYPDTVIIQFIDGRTAEVTNGTLVIIEDK